MGKHTLSRELGTPSCVVEEQGKQTQMGRIMAGDQFLKSLLFGPWIGFVYHANWANNKKVVQPETNPNPKVWCFTFIGVKYSST